MNSQKFLISVTLVIATISSLCANSTQFSLGGAIGFIDGNVCESVYRANNNKYPLLSQLDWDLSMLMFAEAHGEVTLPYGFFVSGSAGAGLPCTSGSMQDYDWKSTSSRILTNFSTHDNRIDRFLCGHIRAGWQYKWNKKNTILSIGPVIGFNGRDLLFTASNGYYQYLSSTQYDSEYSETNQPVYDITKTNLSGDVISYETQQYIVLLGITAGVQLQNGLFFNTTFFLSPYVYVQGSDKHLLTNKRYIDDMNGWKYWSIECTAGRTISNHFSAKLCVSYERLINAEGSTILVDTQINRAYHIITSTGGIDFSQLTVKACFMYQF